MDNSSEVIAQLSVRLEALEQRVLELEHPAAKADVAPAAKDAVQAGSPRGVETNSAASARGIFPVLAKALLGMAGAYLLRATVEAGTLPGLVVVVAILYAGAWLVGAARVRRDRVFAGTAYALTSALILSPMLWELTLRFHVLSPAMSAAVLVAFAVAALALTGRSSFAAVFWVGYATSLLMALVLMIATQRVVPFLCAILVIALVSEVAACVRLTLNGRTLAVVVADIGVAVMLYIYSLPASARGEYGAVSVGLLVAIASVPFFLSFASTTLRSVWTRRQVTASEMMQTVVAFSLATYAAMAFGGGEFREALGVVCLGIAAVAYALAFARFRDESLARNFHAYTIWGAASFLLGSYVSLPPMWFVLLPGVAAVCATAIGARRMMPALEFQGAAFLLTAAVGSGLFAFDAGALIGSRPVPVAWIYAIVLVFALVCYRLGGRLGREGWQDWIPNLLSAAIAAGTGAAFVMMLFAKIAGERGLGGSPEVGLVEFLQTLTLCGAALGLALAGSCWKRQELVWLAYGALAVTGAKILVEDVRHGHLLVIAASFVLYAATLIVLPRLAGHGHRDHRQAGV